MQKPFSLVQILRGSDSEKGTKSSERKSKRRKWCAKMFDYLPDVARPAAPVPDKSDAFGGAAPKPTGHDFPVIPLHPAVMSQLKGRIETHYHRSRSKRKRFNFSRAFNKIYRAPDDTHFAMTKAHSVSAVLLAEMKADSVGVSEVGTEARLKKTSEAGKSEVTCLEKQERASMAFRMINSSQMNNTGMENVFQRLSDRIVEFHNTSGHVQNDSSLTSW